MSLVVFTIQFCPRNTTDNDDWIRSVFDIAEKGLQAGYVRTCAKLYGNPKQGNFLRVSRANLLLAPYDGRPVMDTDYYHLQAVDSYVPVLREMAYVLCDNLLMSRSKDVGQHGLLPVMGRKRVVDDGTTVTDIDWARGVYHWHSTWRRVVLQGPFSSSTEHAIDFHLALRKTWGEFVDNFVTRKSSFLTDVFIYPPSLENDFVSVCGITREHTSTREYATFDAEAYAGAVMPAISESASASTEVQVVDSASLRLFYPRVSYLDQDLSRHVQMMAVLPSNNGTAKMLC